MDVAQVISKRATCFRRAVGAVITAGNRIVSTGYNGVPPGQPHCSGNDCPGKHSCWLTIHAEDNAIRYLPSKVHPTDLYTTDSPCMECAKLIAATPIVRVFYMTPYHDMSGVEFLIKRGLFVYRMTSAGYIIEHSTNNVSND